MPRFECTECNRCRAGNQGPICPEVRGRDLMIIGEEPGEHEEQRARFFVGIAGQTLRAVLGQVTDKFILINSVCCWSQSKPTEKQIDACRVYWRALAAEYKPKLIVALGNAAGRSVLGRPVKITQQVGQLAQVVVEGATIPVLLNYHPSYVNRSEGKKGGEYERIRSTWLDVWDTVQELLAGKPLPKIPEVECLIDRADILDRLEWLGHHRLRMAYDYETWGDVNALRPELNNQFKILTVGVATEQGAFSFPCEHPEVLWGKQESAITKQWFSIVQKHPNLWAQNAKYEHKCNLFRIGQTSFLHDTMLRMNVLDERAGAKLEDIARRAGIRWCYYKSQMEEIQKKPIEAPLEDLLKYNALDALCTYHSSIWLDGQLRKDDKESRREGVACLKENASLHLAHLEFYGMQTDPVVTRRVRTKTLRELEQVKQSFQEHPQVRRVRKWAVANIKSFKTGNDFNPNSHPQMHHLCLDQLKLRVEPDRKGNYSFDKKTLERFAEDQPVIRDLLKVRSLSSSITGFLDKWSQFSCPKHRVHTNYNQEVVMTGRLSSSDPNLQNIKDSEIRRVFVPRWKNGYIVSGDWNQLEPRLLAGWSKDKSMCEALNGGYDLHRWVGAEIYDILYEEITKSQRDLGKRMNLGQMYGQTAYGLSAETTLSYDAAVQLVEKYNERFPGVLEFRLGHHRQAMRVGYVEDLFGARRHLPEAMSEDRWKRERALRQAGNHPIQSTGNHFCLISLCLLREWLKVEKLEALVVGTNHDNLIAECSSSCLEETIQMLRKAMLIHNTEPHWRESPVPVVVDVVRGHDLYKMEKVD